MPRSVEATINPNLLSWARNAMQLSPEVAAEKLKVKVDVYNAWESGDEKPSVAQLRKVGELYKRPIAVFYMPVAPQAFQVIRDFRRIDVGIEFQDEGKLLLEIRRAQDRRETMLELMAYLEEEAPVFPTKFLLSGSAEGAGDQIRAMLGVNFEQQMSWTGRYEAFNAWRDLVERKGGLVNHFAGIPRTEARGFSISEFPCPVIGLNQKDEPSPRIFTLLHEVCHLLLNKGGLCDLDERFPRKESEQKVEVFCNHVAGAALVPKKELFDDLKRQNFRGGEKGLEQAVANLSNRFNVSREVILRRLLILEFITPKIYEDWRAKFKMEWERYQKRMREKKPDGFPSPLNIALSVVGPTFANLAVRAYQRRKITLSRLSEYLNLRTKHIPKVEARVLARMRGLSELP